MITRLLDFSNNPQQPFHLRHLLQPHSTQYHPYLFQHLVAHRNPYLSNNCNLMHQLRHHILAPFRNIKPRPHLCHLLPLQIHLRIPLHLHM